MEAMIDGALAFKTNVNSSAINVYSAEFSGEGAHVVEFAFTDKDMTTSRRTVNYYVQPMRAFVNDVAFASAVTSFADFIVTSVQHVVEVAHSQNLLVMSIISLSTIL